MKITPPKPKKKIIWAIPVLIGVLCAISVMIYMPAPDLLHKVYIALVSGFGSFALFSHLYGLINMILNEDFSQNSPFFNRAIVQVIYLVAAAPVIYGYWHNLNKPLEDTYFDILFIIFSIYSALIVATLGVFIIAPLLAFLIEFLVSMANYFPYKPQYIITYDVSSVYYATVPVSLATIFILSLVFGFPLYGDLNVISLIFLVFLIILFSLDLNSVLIKSVPREGRSKIKVKSSADNSTTVIIKSEDSDNT